MDLQLHGRIALVTGASQGMGRAMAVLGRVDILVNAAGGSRPIPFDAAKEQWREGISRFAF